MALIKALTEDAGIRVGHLRTVAGSLFEHCGRNSWAGVERSTLILEPARAHATFLPEGQNPRASDGPAIILPCGPIIAVLRERLLMERMDVPQGTLRFPPTPLANARRKGEAS